MRIDLTEFARQRRDASGDLPIATLTRIDTPDPSGTLRWTATGSVEGRDAVPHLALTVDGSIALVCQRCLKPMRHDLAIRTRFVVAPDEATAERLDEDDSIDALAQSADFDLDALVEDEVILALPISPRHAVCPDAAAAGTAEVGRPSPFAALAALKAHRPEDDHGH